MNAILNWINGWRVDMDGWLVRARRASDPAWLPSSMGFLEESAIAVRSHSDARLIDRGLSTLGKDAYETAAGHYAAYKGADQ